MMFLTYLFLEELVRIAGSFQSYKSSKSSCGCGTGIYIHN